MFEHIISLSDEELYRYLFTAQEIEALIGKPELQISNAITNFSIMCTEDHLTTIPWVGEWYCKHRLRLNALDKIVK